MFKQVILMGEAKDMVKKFADAANNLDDATKASFKGWAGKSIGFEIDGEKFSIAFDPAGTKATFVDGKIDNPVFTIIADGDYWVKVMKGEEDPMKGFMQKKYSIKGNVMQSTKLQPLLKKIKL